jgi:hypothetical protein
VAARACYRAAADGTAGIPERTYLLMRSARLANP